MATIKVACPKCGQKVSGDESFYGTSVDCPICTANIVFPNPDGSVPSGARPEAPPQQQVAIVPDYSTPAPPESTAVPSDLYTAPPAAEPFSPAPTSTVEPASSEKNEVPSPAFGAISMVCAVLSVVTCVGGLLFAPLAIVFGHTASSKARRSPVRPAPGQTLGNVGLLIGYVYLFFAIVILAIAAFFGEPIRTWAEGLQLGGG